MDISLESIDFVTYERVCDLIGYIEEMTEDGPVVRHSDAEGFHILAYSESGRVYILNSYLSQTSSENEETRVAYLVLKITSHLLDGNKLDPNYWDLFRIMYGSPAYQNGEEFWWKDFLEIQSAQWAWVWPQFPCSLFHLKDFQFQ